MAIWKNLSSALLALLLGATVLRPGQEAAPPGPPPAAAPQVELRRLVREALERNPELQAARRSVEARRARIPQAKAWPDPTVTLGYGGSLLPPYTLMGNDPSSARQFMAEQEIPYPGKTRLRGQIAAREADAEALTYEGVARRVAAEVKQAYFELAFTDQSLATLGKDRELFSKLAKVAEIRYSTGKGAQQEAIRAQVELTRLAERQTLLEQTRRTLEAQLNSLRDLPVDTPVGPAAEVKQAYFELAFTDQSLATLGKDRELFSKLAKVAEIRYSTGKGAQQEAIRAQVELTRLAERQTLLEQTRRTLEAQLNSLRDLPVDRPVGPTADVRPSVVAHSLEELQAAAEASFPALKRQQTMIEGNRLGVDLARKEVRPDFSVGYTYMQRAGLPDMYGITFSTRLPIFRRSKQDQAVREAALNLESARRLEENELTLLRYRVKQEYLQAQAADRLLELYAQGIVPQSTLALESSLASYETGATDFLNVLSNFTTVLDYELGYHQQVAAHEKTLARLEELTGLNLIP